MMMRAMKMAVIVTTLLGTAACGREPKAAQPQQNLPWLDSLMTQPAQPVAAATPVELGQAPVPEAAAPQALASVAEKPARSTTTHHSTSTRSRSAHRSSSSGSSSSSSGTYAGTYQPRTRTVKHTQRDAAIGAGAGAVIGAVAGGGHHRVRGAVIGGVLGGVAGAVIGNNTDKQRVNY